MRNDARDGVRGGRAALVEAWRFKPWLMLGIGYYFAWMLFVVFDLQGLVFVEQGQLPLVPVRIALSGAIAVCLATMMLSIGHLDLLERGKWVLTLAGGVSALGTLLLVVSINYMDSFIPMGCSALLLGAGNSLLFLSWGEHLAKLSPERLSGHVVFSCLFASVAYAVLRGLPVELAIALAVACPVVSGVVLVLCDDAFGGRREIVRSLGWQRDFTRLLASCLVAAVFLGIVRALPVFEVISWRSGLPTAFVMVGAFAATLALLVVMGFGSPVVFLYRVCSVLLILGYATVFLDVGLLRSLSLGLIIGGSVLLEGLALLLLPSVVIRLKRSAIHLFGWMAVALHVGSLIGLILGRYFSTLDSGQTAALAVVALVSLVVLFFFIFKEVDVAGFANEGDGPRQLLDGDRESRIELIAQNYRLSPREKEVFALLVDGRSLPHIESKLVISHSTARTHVKHIYEKLGVTNRQELHDLFECFDLAL